MLQNTAT